MQQEKAVESFAQGSIFKTVLKNAIPAIAAMLMVMIYNLADTFFISLTNNDYMIAAVSLATPVFLIFMSVGTLFGIGGTSVISRALGEGKSEYARKVSAFCMWACIIVGGFMMVAFWIFMEPLLKIMGASADTMEYTKTYMNIVVSCGIFSMISNCYSNIIRAEGKANIAMTGTILGNLLNVVLDPILISGFGLGVAGAAIATVIGNAAAALYYLIYFWRGKSSLSIHPKNMSMKNGILSGVLAIGIPAALANLLMSISQIIVNAQMASHGDLAVAAYGVAAKVLMIVTMVGIGLGQGIQPVLGYCYGAKDRYRFNGILKCSAIFGLVLCTIVTVLCFVFTEPIVRIFLTEATALSDGVTFTRIMLSTSWLFGFFFVLVNALQAMGAATPSLIVSVCRQGVIYIPTTLIMGSAIGMNGLVWAQPIADILSLIMVIALLLVQIKRVSICRQ